MSLNKKCPKCGGTNVQLTEVNSKHGCLWLLLFRWYYVALVVFRYILGFILLICIDWWMAIFKAIIGKGYVWKSGKLFSGSRKYYYCHNCGHNFRG